VEDLRFLGVGVVLELISEGVAAVVEAGEGLIQGGHFIL
jgi:hypothetical protein